MTLRLADAKRIFVDIDDTARRGRKISNKAGVIARLAADIRSESLPEMPPEVAAQVRQGLAEAARAAQRLADDIDRQLPRLEKRLRGVHAALVEEQTSNADRATKWLKGFVKKHNTALDRIGRAAFWQVDPHGQMLDGSSFAKGLGEAAIGTADLAQLGARVHFTRGMDVDANNRLDNAGEAIRQDPGAALRNAVPYDKIIKILDPSTPHQKRKDLISELGGGLAFDAALGGFGGASARAGRASINMTRQGSVRAADLDLGDARKAEKDARSFADATRHAEQQRRRQVANELVPGPGFRPRHQDERARLSAARARAAAERVKKVDDMTAVERAAADKAARAAAVETRRREASEKAFAKAVAQLKVTYVDAAGLRAVAQQIHAILGQFPGLQEAAQKALEEARKRAEAHGKPTILPPPKKGT